MTRLSPKSLGLLAAALLCTTLAVPVQADSKADRDVAEARREHRQGRSACSGDTSQERPAARSDQPGRAPAAGERVREPRRVPGAEKEIRQAKALGAPPEVWKLQLGEALLMQGQNAELLQSILTEPGDSPALAAAVLALRGQALLATGERELARAAFAEALATQPGQERARLGLAALLLAEGKRAEALAALDVLVADAPGNAQARLLRAETLRMDGRLDGAMADFSEVLKGNAADLRARLGAPWCCSHNASPTTRRAISTRCRETYAISRRCATCGPWWLSSATTSGRPPSTSTTCCGSTPISRRHCCCTAR